MKANQHIVWRKEEGIGFLELDNPPGNEMTPGFYRQFHEMVTAVIPGSDVKAIIVRGYGRHFSSGADLDGLYAMLLREQEESESGNLQTSSSVLESNLGAFKILQQLKIPVIAAIRGVCIGAGLELAMFCHFRICAQGAVLGLPESTYGLIPGLGGIQHLASLSGQAKAIELTLQGNTFSAEQALQYGIIDHIVPGKDLSASAIHLAGISAGDYRNYLKHEYLEALKNNNWMC